MAKPRRIIRKPEILARTGLSYSTIWRYERAGEFPQRVRLNVDDTSQTSPVGWYEDEVDQWIKARIRGAGLRPPRPRHASRGTTVAVAAKSEAGQ
jgi:prophage regulatory protein